MKRNIAIFLLMAGALVAQAAGIVTNVTLRQIRPWNGLVEIGYELTETPSAPDGKALGLQVTVTDRATGTAYTPRTFTSAPTYTAGAHRLVWNARADGVAFASSNAVATVAVVRHPPLYLVIDLSGGTSATSYPVTSLADVPAGGWTDEYKTTKLVLRRIEPGTFTMGSPSDEVGRSYDETLHTVTLTKAFHIGVFEVTQRQWELVMGSNPSSYKGGTRPVECVSYNMARGASTEAGWPGSSGVDATSFFGRLRARTGLDTFDLPTEAQWEYACRAGTTTALNSGKNLAGTGQDSAMDEVGRYGYNNGYQGGSVDGKGGYSSKHTTVGSYKPNAWGLYDMHGNVYEWCLDWDGSQASSVATDPVGAASGRYRLLRGGSWYNLAQYCRSAFRNLDYPLRGNSDYGLRVCLR